MTRNETPRRPRVFQSDDPALAPSERAAFDTPPPSPDTETPEVSAGGIAIPTTAQLKSGIRWGALLISALVALASLAAGVWFARFISVALAREDWVGWLALGLLALAGATALVIALREIIGLLRLRSLREIRSDADTAVRQADATLAGKAARRLCARYRGRNDMAWALQRFGEHETQVHDGSDILILAERELIVPLDTQARQIVLQSAKRVTMVTAISPMAWIAMLFVLAENLRMLRRLASLYGGRPGFIGGLRLARLVFTHIVATGGMALTDDLFGQFLGQDIMRRLSRRLGEGVFNGALTARVGTATIDVCRPLPFLEAKPPRLRDFVSALWQRRPEVTGASDDDSKQA